MGKSSLLPLSMGTSSTSCQRLRTKRSMMATRVLTLVDGCFACQFLSSQSVVDTAVDTIVKPVLEGMIKEGRPGTCVLTLVLS